MKAFIISDKDHQTEAYSHLHALVCSFLSEKGYAIEAVEIGRNDLAYCMGCFGCWIKKPGECVIQDTVAQVNRTCMNSDVVFYLSPVVFGQFSANIKNVIDRWLPNMLPFFETRPDGSTIHPPRYDKYPKQIIIGYGDDISQADQQLFIDITKKHRRNVETFCYTGSDPETCAVLRSINLKQVGNGL